MSSIASKDNPRLRRWHTLVRDAATRRREHCALIEGAHLVAACLDSGAAVRSLILSKSGAGRPELSALAGRSAKAPVVLSDTLFRQLSDTEAPSGIAAEIAIPAAAFDLKAAPACVFLEAIQDAGNVGAILRSAAAFGIRHAVLGAGCADAWSPKVLRAAMGAHFLLQVGESADLAVTLGRFGGRTVCTVPHGGVPLSEVDLSGRLGWVFGSEGRGVSARLVAAAALKVRIPMPGGTESLNVAAAAAICFYEASRCGARF